MPVKNTVTNLYRSFDRSLNWIYTHLEFFRLPEYNPGEEQFMDMHRKRFAELALSLSFLSKNKKLAGDHRVEAIANFVAANTGFDNNFNLARNLNLVPYYLVIRNGLLSAGKDIPGFRVQLDQIMRLGFVQQIERAPWNNIDLRYNLDASQIKHTMPGYTSLYELSCLANFPELAYIRDNDCYAITHLIFYLSDFGNTDIKDVLKDKYKKVKNNVGLLLGLYTYNEEWDLVAEFLMCCNILKYRNFPLFDLCWQKLLESQSAEGDFSSPCIKSRLEIEKIETEEERFSINYHPTLVSMFASAMELKYLN